MKRMFGANHAAALAGIMALAAAPSVALAALSYDFSLGASLNSTDNLHLDAEPQEEGQRAPVQEMIYAVTPGFQLDWSEARDHLASNYAGNYWTFTGDEDRDPEWINQLSADLGWRRWEPYFLESSAMYERVPRSEGDENEAIVDQLDRKWLRVRTGLFWELGETSTAELAYRGEIESFSGGGDDEDDRIVHHDVEAVARRRGGPLWGIELGVRYGQVSRELTEDYSELRLTWAFDRRLSERLRASVRADWVRENYDASESDDGDGDSSVKTQTNVLKTAELRGELERGGFWSLSYEERIEPQPDGDTLIVGRTAAASSLRARLGSVIGAGVWYEDRNYRISDNDRTAWGPTVIARWMIAPWAALDMGGSWAKTRTKEPDAEHVEDRTTRAGGAFVVLLGRRWVVEAGYVYRENDSTNDEYSYKANLFSAGLTYHFRVIPPGRLPSSAIVELVFSDTMVAQVR